MKKCSYCGQENEDAQDRCGGCGTELLELSAPVTVSKPTKLTRASFGVRAMARGGDAVLELGLSFAAGALAGTVLGVLNAGGHLPHGWQRHVQNLSAISILFTALGSVCYHTFCEGLHGASFGKAIYGLRVVGQTGKPCGLKAAWLRSWAFLVDGLVFGLVAYESMRKSALNQRYGDVWAKTVVLLEREIPRGAERTTARFILGLALGAGSLVVCTATGMVLKVMLE